MKILYLTYEPPFFPGGNGGETRQYNLLKHLSSRNEVHLFLPWLSPERMEKAREVSSRVVTPPVPYVAGGLSLLLRRFDRGYPSFTSQLEGVRAVLMPLVRLALLRERYDVVHVEHTNVAHWMARPCGVPRILVAQNVKTLMWERYAETAAGAEKEALAEDARRFRKYESTFLPCYDRVVAVSSVDRELLRDLTGNRVPIDTVDNGVDTSYFTPGGEAEPDALVFTGTMNHPPNREGILHFCNEILPLVRRDETVRLSIVGNNPPQDVVSLGNLEGVRVTGFVPDTRPYIAGAAVVVVPLLSGSGTRLKILEAMAMGKAVVATSVGAEGIQYTNGHDIVIADSPAEFASAVVTLLRDPVKRAEMGGNARRLVERLYGWESLAARLEESYAAAVAGFRREGR